MAADSGEFYYLINPCVSKKRSTINKEGCSNDLYKTASISYESTLKKTFLAIAHELSDLEIKVGTTVENIKVLATQIMFEQEACEKIAATKAANVGFFRGIAQLVAGTVGGVVGAMFGGPIGAVQGATSFMGIARNLLLKFGPQVKLDCSGADKYRYELAVEVNLLEAYTDLVTDRRNAMAGQNAQYRKLNQIIESETDTDGGM